MLPIQVQGRSLDEVLRLAQPSSSQSINLGFSPETLAAKVRRIVKHPLLMRDRRCLREGLLTYKVLAEAGWQPRLHFGLEPGAAQSPSIKAHCWVTLDDRIVAGASDTEYVEILVHPSRVRA